MSVPDDPGLQTVYVGDRATARRFGRAALVVIDGPARGRRVVIERAKVTIGRTALNTLALDDRAASAVHAEIEASEGGFAVRDLGSTNGVYVGEVRLRDAIVPLGTRLRIGTSTVQLEPAEGTVEIALHPHDHFDAMLGKSLAMRAVFAELAKLAPTDITVLVTGETGTGKELVARALHNASPRIKGPFVVQDCSALPATLAESILFGHEKGSFTGAGERRAGSFEQAHRGTLFLDEIGELPLDQQAKLLRVLERHEVRRVGGDKTLEVDVRVVAATHRDLRAMVGAGKFREDLYYRLSVATVELPALRARSEDVPMLADAMLVRFRERNPTVTAERFAPEVRARFVSLPWPGNVRELRNMIERAASLATGPEIGLGDLAPLHHDRTPPAGIPVQRWAIPGDPALSATVDALPSDLGMHPWREARQKVGEAFEREYLRALMARHHGNLTQAASAAGMQRTALREALVKWGLRGEKEGD